jgi:hypothetical protein
MLTIGSDLELGPCDNAPDLPDLSAILGVRDAQRPRAIRLYRLGWLWLLVQLIEGQAHIWTAVSPEQVYALVSDLTRMGAYSPVASIQAKRDCGAVHLSESGAVLLPRGNYRCGRCEAVRVRLSRPREPGGAPLITQRNARYSNCSACS